jgi:hypothetical protein
MKTITSEQREQLLRIIIRDIRITDRKNMKSFGIQMNNEVVKYFTAKGEEKLSDDGLPSPFFVCFDIREVKVLIKKTKCNVINCRIITKDGIDFYGKILLVKIFLF